MQESLAANRIEKFLQPRREATLEMRRQYVPRADFLAILRENVARPDFYAPPGYFRDFHEAFKGMTMKRAAAIERLMHRLRKPRQFPSTAGPAPAGATSDEDWQEQLEEMEAVEFPIPHPKIPVAEGAERKALREELLQQVTEEQEVAERAINELIEENEKPLTTFECDQLAADVDGRRDALLRRQEESCFRQFWRMGSFLMKLQDRQDRMEQSEDEGYAQESEVRSPESEVGAQEADVRGPESEVCGDDADAAGHEFSVKENEGASGDVDENTGGDVGQGMMERRTIDSNDSQGAVQARTDSSEKRVDNNSLPAAIVASERLPGTTKPSIGADGEKVAESGLSEAA
jgi:hypothetical protein